MACRALVNEARRRHHHRHRHDHSLNLTDYLEYAMMARQDIYDREAFPIEKCTGRDSWSGRGSASGIDSKEYSENARREREKGRGNCSNRNNGNGKKWNARGKGSRGRERG